MLLRTTKYYSTTTPYYKVLLCTLKYYASTTLYYKVLLQYYRTTKYYSSTTPALLRTTPAAAPAAAPAQHQHQHQQHQHHQQNVDFTTVSCDRHARSYERVARAGNKSSSLLQFRTIHMQDSTKGLHPAPQDRNFQTSCDRQARSRKGLYPAPQVRAMDTHDLTKGLHFRKHFPDHGAPPLLLK